LKAYQKQVDEFDEEIGALIHIKALDQKRAEVCKQMLKNDAF